LKYCTKNSDQGRVSFQVVRYDGRKVTKEDKLEYFAATRIASACECFANICGNRRHHMSPTVIMLRIHLKGMKIILAQDTDDETRKVDKLSPLERYLCRPVGDDFHKLTYRQYYSQFMVSSKRTENSLADQGIPIHYVHQRKKRAISILHSVSINDPETFALRLLLKERSGRNWDDFKMGYQTYHEAAVSLKLIDKFDGQAISSLKEARTNGQTPSQLRSLYVLMLPQLSDRSAERIKRRFWESFKDRNDTDETLKKKFDFLTKPSKHPVEPKREVNPLDALKDEQKIVASKIVKRLLKHETNQIMFLQGAAGTGKTFTVQRLLAELFNLGLNCIITATTGIAAVQYNQGTTLHSAFKLGIDETKSVFCSTIGRDTALAHRLLAANLIVIDEVSMLTPDLANRVSMTLQQLTVPADRRPFAGKNILFVGDLFQLPPVVKDSSIPVIQRLITQLEYWSSIKKYSLSTPRRTEGNKNWTDFLAEVARGKVKETSWHDLALRFPTMTVTDKVNDATEFFRKDIQPNQDFPLDRLWICATNDLARQVNNDLQNWRSTGAERLGSVKATTTLVTELNCPGFATSHQIDMIEKLDLPDLPPQTLLIYKGDPMFLLRNIDIRLGLAKGRRCTAKHVGEQTVVVQFDDGVIITLPRMALNKQSNGIVFKRYQVPLRLIFAGTVHRAQGMTLNRVVIDCRSKFWEHGQMYVALSRVKDPSNLCILIPPGDSEFTVPVDENVVKILQILNGEIPQDQLQELAHEVPHELPGEHWTDEPESLPFPQNDYSDAEDIHLPLTPVADPQRDDYDHMGDPKDQEENFSTEDLEDEPEDHSLIPDKEPPISLDNQEEEQEDELHPISQERYVYEQTRNRRPLISRVLNAFIHRTPEHQTILPQNLQETRDAVNGYLNQARERLEEIIPARENIYDAPAVTQDIDESLTQDIDHYYRSLSLEERLEAELQYAGIIADLPSALDSIRPGSDVLPRPIYLQDDDEEQDELQFEPHPPGPDADRCARLRHECLEMAGFNCLGPKPTCPKDCNSILGYGLRNVSLNCYANAFIEVLFHILPFRRFILSQETQSDTITSQLQGIFESFKLKQCNIAPVRLSQLTFVNKTGLARKTRLSSLWPS
jgi:hypothetical protein